MEDSLCADESDDVVFVLAADGHAARCSATLHHHGFEFTPSSGWALSATELVDLQCRWTDELRYSPPDEADLAEFYGRPVNSGELACFASHHAAWVTAATRLGVKGWDLETKGASVAGDEEEWVAVVLEDDVTVVPCHDVRMHLHRSRWLHVWALLRAELTALKKDAVPWDLVYLGRNLHGHDSPVHNSHRQLFKYPDKLCRAGFSTCAHAYVLSASGVAKLLALSLHKQVICRSHTTKQMVSRIIHPFDLHLDKQVMPVDDILPALYSTHPRQDVDAHAKRLLSRTARTTSNACLHQKVDMDTSFEFDALSFKEDLVWQLESLSHEEGGVSRCVGGGWGRGGRGGEVESILVSDITGSPHVGAYLGTQFTGFTGTKAQILTQKRFMSLCCKRATQKEDEDCVVAMKGMMMVVSGARVRLRAF